MDLQNLFLIAGAVLFCFIVFCIQFIYKQIQFVLVAVNLYKKMVQQQDDMISILIEIRNQITSSKQQIEYKPIVGKNDSSTTKNRDPNSDTGDEESLEFCYHCGSKLKKTVATCPDCGKDL